jgi:hypothetical protein
MGNQRTFASMAWNGKGKVTRRERFLAEMDAVIPWPRLVRLIEPHYPFLMVAKEVDIDVATAGHVTWLSDEKASTQPNASRAHP